MTGTQIIAQFENIADETIDGTQELILLNMAKNEIESMRPWNFLRAFDNSKTALTSDSYLTTKVLPADFLYPRVLYLNGDRNPYMLIPFEERERVKDIYKRWYVDYANGVYALCGKVSATTTINFYYIKSTADVTLTTSPVWPSIYHPLIGFKMAEMYMSGSDADELNFKMAPQNLRIANQLLKQMIQWDSRIITLELNEKNKMNFDVNSYPDVVDLY